MLTKKDYEAADKLIEGALKMYQDSFERAKDKLVSVLNRITDLDQAGEIDLSFHQFKSITMMISAIQAHNVQGIETEIENLYVHGEVGGVLKELINIAKQFETLNFKE